MKNTIKYIAPALLAAAVGSANAVTIASSSLDTNTLGTTVTWATDANSSMVTDDLTAIGGAFTVLGSNSTDNDISNGTNMSAGASQGFSFEITTTADFDLTTFTIDAGHLNSGGGNQSFLSDLDLSIDGISGTVFAYTNSIDQIDYTTGAARLSQSFDLTGQTLVAGTYRVSISMQEGALAIGGAFSSFDNVALSGDLSPIPEPSSTALLGLGGLALILRRRK